MTKSNDRLAEMDPPSAAMASASAVVFVSGAITDTIPDSNRPLDVVLEPAKPANTTHHPSFAPPDTDAGVPESDDRAMFADLARAIDPRIKTKRTYNTTEEVDDLLEGLPVEPRLPRRRTRPRRDGASRSIAAPAGGWRWRVLLAVLPLGVKIAAAFAVGAVFFGGAVVLGRAGRRPTPSEHAETTAPPAPAAASTAFEEPHPIATAMVPPQPPAGAPPPSPPATSKISLRPAGSRSNASMVASANPAAPPKRAKNAATSTAPIPTAEGLESDVGPTSTAPSSSSFVNLLTGH